MTIGEKFSLGYAIIAVYVGIVGFFGFFLIKQAYTEFDIVLSESVPLIRQLEQLRLSGSKVVSTSREIVLLVTQSSDDINQRHELVRLKILELREYNIKRYIADFDEVNKVSATIRQTPARKKITDYLTRLDDAGKNLLEIAFYVIKYEEENRSIDELLELNLYLERSEIEFLTIINQIIAVENDKLSEKSRSISQSYQTAIISILLLTTIVFAAAYISGLLVSKSVSRPILKLKEAAEKIGTGDFSTQIDVSSNDETGVLARTFVQMVNGLKTAREELEQSNRRLEERVQERTEELSNEVKEHEETEGKLRFKIGVEQIIRNLTTWLISMDPERIEETFKISFKEISTLVDVDCVQLFQWNDDYSTISSIYEWVGENISSKKKLLQNLPTSKYSWFEQSFIRPQTLAIDHINDLGPENQNEKELLQGCGVASIVFLPLFFRKRPIALLACGSSSQKNWSPEMINVLEIVSGIFVHVLMRSQHAEELIRLKKAIETSPIGITIADMDRRIVYANPADAIMHGYRVDELIGRDPRLFAPEEYWHSKDLRKIDKPQILKRESINVRKDGSRFPVSLISGFITDTNNKPIGLITICEDITERKKTENELKKSREELRSLYDHLQNIREEERSAISREIHDELGQFLTGLKMDLYYLKNVLGDSQTEIIETLENMSHIIEETIRTIQHISAELRPRMLDEFGLVPTIEWYVEEFQKRLSIDCQLFFDPTELKVDNKLSITIFRILQEALTNIARHAQANKVTISLTQKDDKIRLYINDNGIGITTEQISSSDSLGLIGMRERLSTFNGDIEFLSDKEKGTLVKVVIPMPKELRNSL